MAVARLMKHVIAVKLYNRIRKVRDSNLNRYVCYPDESLRGVPVSLQADVRIITS
jgi:hypothetical protein